MKRAIVVTAAALLASGAPAAAADVLVDLERQQQDIFARVAPAVVFIANGEFFGSGFFVSSDGLILTNAHVVQGAKQVKVILHSGGKYAGEVVERAKNNTDLALVRIGASETPSLPLSGLAGVGVGSWVAAVGHGRGAVWTFNTGMISNTYPDKAERPVFQTQIPLNPGNSGGPIVDREGRVVGIVTAGLEGANSINFGIAMEVARSNLAGLASTCDCLVISSPKGVPVFVDGTMAGVGPRVVVPAVQRHTYEVFAVIGGQKRGKTARFPEQREVTIE